MNNQHHGIESGVAGAEGRKVFSFVPRNLVERPAAFGKTPELLPPAPGVDARDPRYQAALMQHRIAEQVRQHLRLENRSVAWFAAPRGAFPGIGVDRMRRMLRGETMMQIADVMLISSLVPRSRSVAASAVGFDVGQANKAVGEAKRYSKALKMCTCDAWPRYQRTELLFGSEL